MTGASAEFESVAAGNKFAIRKKQGLSPVATLRNYFTALRYVGYQAL